MVISAVKVCSCAVQQKLERKRILIKKEIGAITTAVKSARNRECNSFHHLIKKLLAIHAHYAPVEGRTAFFLRPALMKKGLDGGNMKIPIKKA